jgi:hypothetical protein
MFEALERLMPWDVKQYLMIMGISILLPFEFLSLSRGSFWPLPHRRILCTSFILLRFAVVTGIFTQRLELTNPFISRVVPFVNISL